MKARWSLPPRVRPLLEAGVERVLDDVAGPGTSPTFVASDLMLAVELACREAGCAELVDAWLDAARADDLTDPKVRRRIEPGLEKLGTYEASRWSYPDATEVLALIERVFRIEWVEPPEPSPPEGPPEGTVPTPYAPDVPLSAGAWIAHPKLGVGLVQKTQSDRIHVRFADRERTLLHRAIVAAPRVEVMSEDVAAARAALDAGLSDFASAWRALGHDPKKSFLDAVVGKPGLHPRQVAQDCVTLAETTFGATLARRTRAYDEEHGTVQRVPDRLLHEQYSSPAAVVAAVVKQRVRPSKTDDDEIAGLHGEIVRRLTTLG